MRLRIPRRLRWAIAERLDKRPGMCWAELVGWALDGRTFWPVDGGRAQDTCRRDADEAGSCYCGKVRNEAKQRELDAAAKPGEGPF